MCETLDIGSNLPVPDPQEYKPFSTALGELGIENQAIPTIETGTDVVILTNGKSILDMKSNNTVLDYTNGMTVMKANDFGVLNIVNGIDTKKSQLCLLPKKLEMTTKFHKQILKTKAPKFVRLLKQLKSQMENYLSAEFTTKPLITTLKTEMVVPKSIYHLYDCVNHYRINEILFGPENTCFKHIKQIIKHLSNVNDLLNQRKRTIRIGYDEIGAQKINNNTMVVTIKRPNNMLGEIYELFMEGGTPLDAFHYVMYKTDGSCYGIPIRPETMENNVIIRKITKLTSKCCQGLMDNNNTIECTTEDGTTNKNYYQISPTLLVWAFYFNILVSAISLTAGVIMIIRRIKSIYQETDYYKIKKIREQKKKRNKRREIELAELGYDQETNFIKTKPSAPELESDDSNYRIELVSAYKKRKMEPPTKSRKKKQRRKAEL